MNLQEMTEARVKAIHDAREYLERAEKENREMNAEETESYDRAMKEADSLKNRIEKRQAHEIAESTLTQSAGRKVVVDDIATRQAKAEGEYRKAFDSYVRKSNGPNRE